MAIPERNDVLVLPNADGTPAHLRPVPVCRVNSGRIRRVDDTLELIPNDRKDEVLPQAVRDALAEADNPLAARQVQGVFPDRTPHP